MSFDFANIESPPFVGQEDWRSWKWQARSSLSHLGDFQSYFNMSEEELRAFSQLEDMFRVRVTPYYARVADRDNPNCPVRRMLMPSMGEVGGAPKQEMLDPLGERRHSPVNRIIHRYPDRCLLLATDFCSVYCRYCTRKHFTAGDAVLIRQKQLDEALSYIRAHESIREVILSGGDPLTLSDAPLLKLIAALRQIPHVEIIRLATRIPVVLPMRITSELLEQLKAFHPIYIMTHFNHPKEITLQAQESLSLLVNNGFPVFNQMVLLNGINNHEAIVQALSRRLLYLRVKPYYMFHCDPSLGTDHMRTTIEDSEAIQRELWGRVSGLMMPNLSLDIPGGGGKVGLVPNFETHREKGLRSFKGWDGICGDYVDPKAVEKPQLGEYLEEWERIRNAPG